ncbi:PIN domain-containing protein [Synechocystis sp. PCC 7339]|nr:PIN domain-containing protein [Synechocystis sp. PCC 7338]UAJ72434.1 PIN domain-containing protein [Synechocystis sp. PCC 7339]
MNGKSLLDTNIIIALFLNETIAKEKLVASSQIFVPSIVIGELCYGARKSGRVQANLNSPLS